MFNITKDLYKKVCSEFKDATVGQKYWSGSISSTFEDLDIQFKFVTSVIINDGELIPVWWEFHTSDHDQEILNDFIFSEFARNYLKHGK